MTEAKSAAGLIDHVLRKHGYYWQAKDADIPDTIGADLIAVVLSYAAERERLLAESDEQIFDVWHWMERKGLNGVTGPITTAAMERHKSRLSSRPATEGKGDD